MAADFDARRVVPPVWTCGAYRAGHDMHYIQARRSAQNGPGVARTIESVADDGTITCTDGTRLWNHDPARLRTIIEIHGNGVMFGTAGVLRIPSGDGTYCISVTSEPDPCRPETAGSRPGENRSSRSSSVGVAEDGALCLGELDADGNVVLVPLARTKIEQRANADSTWRWYGVYDVPEASGGGTIRVRLDTTDDDRRRRFNRCEHLRPIPPSDPDYARLYPRRADAESINRALDDTCWLGRAHSAGRARQLVNLIGYAIAVNSLALHRHRRALAPPGRLAA